MANDFTVNHLIDVIYFARLKYLYTIYASRTGKCMAFIICCKILVTMMTPTSNTQSYAVGASSIRAAQCTNINLVIAYRMGVVHFTTVISKYIGEGQHGKKGN